MLKSHYFISANMSSFTESKNLHFNNSIILVSKFQILAGSVLKTWIHFSLPLFLIRHLDRNPWWVFEDPSEYIRIFNRSPSSPSILKSLREKLYFDLGYLLDTAFMKCILKFDIWHSSPVDSGWTGAGIVGWFLWMQEKTGSKKIKNFLPVN